MTNSNDMILITGGAGFIGSHTALLLLESNLDVIIIDNFSNSTFHSLQRIEKITGRTPHFIEGDICNKSFLDNIFSNFNISSVIHFAGLKSVGDSVSDPLNYYINNVFGSMNLVQAMTDANVFKLVFSSSATVYGDSTHLPISENSPTGKLTNPYGRSKLMVEQILSDLADSDDRWKIAILRYFNPVGAHESGLIGECPRGIPNNLMPFISQVAIGKRAVLSVYGQDYPTLDGTGVRDYIHVVDLANGHLKALHALDTRSGANIWNLGTGIGYSVLQMIKAFEQETGRKIPYNLCPRRPGDIAESYADPSKANYELNWTAVKGLHEMIRDTWRWQSLNPDGYLD